MQARRMRVMVPEDHRVVVDLPETIRSGPVELIVLVPPENEAEEDRKPEGQGRLASLAADLAKDPIRPTEDRGSRDRGARSLRAQRLRPPRLWKD